MYHNNIIDINNTEERSVVLVDGKRISTGLASLDGGWQRAVAAYIAQKDVKQSSRLAYTKALTQFFHWIERTGRDISLLQSIDILEYKDWLDRTGHSVLTRSLYIVSVKGFYAWAEGLKLYPNIAKNVKSSKKSERSRGRGGKQGHFVKMHLTDEEGSRFLEYFRTRPVQELKDGTGYDLSEANRLRDYAMMNLMIRTGIRSVEVNRANINDITTRMGKRVLYVQGKGKVDKGDFVVLSDMAYEPIQRYLETRPGALAGEPLFTCEGRGSKGRRLSTRTIQYIGKEGLRSIGLDDHMYSIHSLRHTAGVQILKNGGTQFDVQDVLRHASPETSQIYLESIKEERRLQSSPETLLDKAFLSTAVSRDESSLDTGFLE